MKLVNLKFTENVYAFCENGFLPYLRKELHLITIVLKSDNVSVYFIFV